jgi:hypothetical protein
VVVSVTVAITENGPAAAVVRAAALVNTPAVLMATPEGAPPTDHE